jgi:dihydrofolate reductase
MIISAIVAAAKNGVIGHHNSIPWYLPEDFKFFKKTTLNHHVIMGRKCYESIGKPLPNRVNIIVTRDPFYIVNGCITVHAIEEGLQYALDQGETEVFIIGGGEIYSQSKQYWDRVYLTEVDLEPEGDVFFPDLPAEEWLEVSRDNRAADDKNAHPYSFVRYERVVSEEEE